MTRLLRFVKRFRIFLIVIALIAGVVIWQRSQSQAAKNIETTKVTRGQLVETISSSGKTKTLEQVDLHFQTGGRLSWVGVKEGDTVFAGQAIASLDARALKKELEKSLRAYSKERNDFEEAKEVVYKDKIVTDTIKRILEKNQWDLETAVLDVELDDIAFGWATLTSPIAGTVTHMDTPVAGVNVTSSDSFIVSSLGKLVFSANVDETDIGKITIGMPVDIELDAFADQTFGGKVSKIAFLAETTNAGATVFPVEIVIANPTNLRIGLNGDVTFKVNEVTSALSVPLEAVREDGETKFVYVKENGNFRKQSVKTGLATEDMVEITQGLSENTEIVTEGFQNLPKNIQ